MKQKILSINFTTDLSPQVQRIDVPSPSQVVPVLQDLESLHNSLKVVSYAIIEVYDPVDPLKP